MADIRQTPQLDDFAWGVFEDPISHGGTWANVDTFWNGLRGGLGSINANNFSWSYWTAGPYSGNIEIWGHASGGGLGAAGEGWRLGMFQSVGGSNSADGYQFLWFGNPFGGWSMRRYDNVSPTNIGTGLGGPGPGHALLRYTAASTLFEGFVSTDGGANWTLAWSATDSTYTGPFYLAMSAEDPSGGGVGWDAFGGGAGKNRPQIYRILRGQIKVAT